MTAQQRHVVAVNDTEEILDLFEEIITGLGHRCSRLTYAPTDGREIADLKPDLVIIDFVLGGREYEGWQLIQKLRMQKATVDVPILACTGAVRQVREMEGQLMEQKVRVLFKPFSASDLEARIEDALKGAR